MAGHGSKSLGFPAAVVFLVLCSCFNDAKAYYLPGVTPTEYERGDNVTIKVNSMKSTKTAIPFDYYSLMFCRPKDGVIKADVENFGEILWGDVIKPSRYLARMRIDKRCEKLCTTKPLKEIEQSRNKPPAIRQLKKLKQRIDDEYRGHLILDGLPVSEVYIWEGRRVKGDEGALYYKTGYPLGIPGNKTHPTLVHNHLAFTIKYHTQEGMSMHRIVGFNVVPYSVSSSKIETECREDNEDWRPETYPPQTVVASPPADSTPAITWSYSLRWQEDRETLWATRWDHYLKSTDATDSKIHWFSIVNSLIIVMFLSAMVAGTLVRTLHRDFNRYYDPENPDEAQEETGWKRIYADVFRPPENSVWLSVLVGSGVQLIGMGSATMCFALAGLLSPANRGALLTSMLLLFVLMGFLGGFVTARILKMFHRQSWKNVLILSIFYPGQVFGVFFLLDLMLWSQGASSAVPFLTFFWIVSLWFFVSVPLVFIGAAMGFRRPLIEAPVRIKTEATAIPVQKWYLHPYITCTLGGLIPFGAAFIELYFIMSSLWQQKFYYVFGFLALVMFILVVTCAEISIVITYFHLCYEDHRWWWRSFFASGSSGLHLFVYTIVYFFFTLKIKKFVTGILYFGWMFMMSYTFAIVTGTIGFASTWVFVWYIYRYGLSHVD